MPRRKSLRSQLYRAARDLGNVEAAEQGPGALARRQVRRAAYRRTNRGRWVAPGLRIERPTPLTLPPKRRSVTHCYEGANLWVSVT